MATCLKCGKECEMWLCDECRQNTDIEELFTSILYYSPHSQYEENNPIWDKISSQMENWWDIRNLAYTLTDFLPTPRKEFRQIHYFAKGSVRIPRENKTWFYEVYDKIINMDGLTEYEVNRLKGLMLETLYQDYRYAEAEALASELTGQNITAWQTAHNLADYFSKTRRYDKATDAINTGLTLKAKSEAILKLQKDISERMEEKKKEYSPGTKDAKAKYAEFMSTLGITVNNSSSSKAPTAIPRDEYPEPKEHRNADFNSFVAFDLETTGTSCSTDAIIELGAIKVINGEIVETAEFEFQEFIKPFKKKLTPKITELTGITEDDVKDARNMWDVFADFMEFAKNNILVGYNSITFDSKFLVRAGRYSHIIMENHHFDVKRYLKSIKENIGYTESGEKLEDVSKFLGIKNPNAHRALADAVTTAKVFLRLRELDKEKSVSVNKDNILDMDW